MAQTILLFEIGEEKKKALDEICTRLKIHRVDVRMGDYLQKLGYLAGIQGFSRENAVYQGGAFPMEMLVFSGMDSEQVDVFLDNYRASKALPIGLKAILTPQNIFWTPKELFAELLKEHISLHPQN